MFFFLEFIVWILFFDKNHWFQLLSTKNDWVISLLLISVTLHSLSFKHSIMSSVGEETSFGFWWKAYCYSSPSPLREKILFLKLIYFYYYYYYYYFVFVFWPIKTATVSFQSLIHSNPAQCISFGRKVTWFTTA